MGIIIFIFLCIGLYLYSIYHKTNYLSDPNFTYYLIAFFILCELFYIWKWRRLPFLSLDEIVLGKKLPLIKKLGALFGSIILPIVMSSVLLDTFNVLYTKIFGSYETPYKVDILEIKHVPYSSRRNQGYTHIYVLTKEQKQEILDVSTSFYKKISLDDQLLITRKSSSFGYYIDEDEIVIIKNKP